MKKKAQTLSGKNPYRLAVHTIRAERGIMCECCGKQPWTQNNHCIIHRSKGQEKHLDVMDNSEMVCAECHISKRCDSRLHKKSHWAKQVERGYNMDAWWDSLPWQLTTGRAKPK